MSNSKKNDGVGANKTSFEISSTKGISLPVNLDIPALYAFVCSLFRKDSVLN